MSPQLEPATTFPAAVYRLLKDDEPLSVDELTQRLNRGPGHDIDLRDREITTEDVRDALKDLVKQGHVTHGTAVDSDGQVKWQTTTRPDLNPKPDGRHIADEEFTLATQ